VGDVTEGGREKQKKGKRNLRTMKRRIERKRSRGGTRSRRKKERRGIRGGIIEGE
jgi:hypothetical protein